MSLTPHPDRLAQNLAHRARLLEQGFDDDVMQPGPGSADARMDLKTLAHRTRRALCEHWTAEAEARLAGLSSADLSAGTIQDGTARGFKVALEEALSLCAPPKGQEQETKEIEGLEAEVIEGRELQRRRDILVASAGPRIRFRPRQGILFVDRKRGIHEEN